MKAAVKTEVLKKILGHVSVATESTVPLPILGSVLIQFEKGGAKFSATNLKLFISEVVTETNEVNVKQSGGACVSLRLLKQFVARAESKSVLFELKDKFLIVSYGQNVANLEVLPSEEFPPPFTVESEKEIECHASSLTAPLLKIIHAVSQDESQFSLTGVNVHRNSAGSEFAATNSRRIAVCKSSAQIEGEDFIIPSKAVRAITSLIESGEVKLKTDRQVILITSGNLEIACRLLEATYPKYQNVIPEPSSSAFSAQRKELIEAIQTAAIFMRANEIELQLRGKGKELEISCFDRFKTKLVGTELSGQPDQMVRVNFRYLLEALQVCEEDMVRIECEERKPLVIREGQFTEVMNPLLHVGAVKAEPKKEEKQEQQIPF